MVKLYTQPDCAPCEAVKSYLKNKNIQYEELDRSEHAQYMMDNFGTIATPVVQTDKGIMVGLSYSTLASIV